MPSKEAKAAVTPVRQRTQYTCMATSMMMCLQAVGHDVSEDEVNKVMGARPMKGAAWEQALACAQHYGCRATLTVPATVQQIKEWTDRGIPVMIAWNPEGREWSHASVVFDVDEDLNVYVADPNIPDPDETVRVMPKSEFYGKWYEKWPDYLVRRPAMAVEREITPDGKQVMASAVRVASALLAKRKTQEVRRKKDKNAPVKVKVDRLRKNPAAEAAGARSTTRGQRRKERGRAVERGHTRKDKHKGKRTERQYAASPSRVALRHVQGKSLDLSGMSAEEALAFVMEDVKRKSPNLDYSWRKGLKMKRVLGDMAADGSQQAQVRGEIVFSRGITLEGMGFKEFLKQFPREGAALLKKAYAKKVRAEKSALQKAVQDRIKRRPQQFFESLFDDYQEAEEYEVTDASIGNMELGREVSIDRWGRVSLPFTVEAVFSATKLPSLDEGVFSAMDDRELNRWIEGWASYAPENFYMDGETGMSSRELFRHYRNQWRKLSPRRQQQKYTQLHRYVR